MKTSALSYTWLTAAWLLCFFVPYPAHAGSEFFAIAYHDVVDYRSELTYDAVTLDNLIDHFEWLKVNGYHPVSINELKAARAGTKPLPDKAILLSWDDGYTSFYTHVLPLLKAYNYPAVLALVGTWMAPEPEEMVQYGDKLVPRKKFLTWQQVKEISASGLVEIASHSNNLHTAILADRSGDRLPATIAHSYDPAAATYETDQEFNKRIRDDLQAAGNLIQKYLGFKPQVLAWPFGRYNAAAQKIAAEVGLPITLTLNPVPADTDYLEAVARIYPTRNPDLKTFISYLESPARAPVKRFFRVDSRDLLEPSPPEELHFSALLDRVKDLDPNMIILDPVVDVNGTYQALFTNSRFPMAQDRLTRLTWHTSKRAGAGVYIRLTSSLFTPMAGETEETVNNFFSDMGKSAPGEGLIVNDPGFVHKLLEFVVNSPDKQGVRGYWNPEKRRRARGELSRSGGNPQVARVIQALAAFQQWQPFQEIGLVVSREQFKTLERPQFNVLLNFFDFLILDAGKENIRPLGKAISPQLKTLQDAGYMRKLSVMLSTEGRHSSLEQNLRQLPPLNIINWGYRFDRFLEEEPAPDSIRPLLSKRSFPYPLRP